MNSCAYSELYLHDAMSNLGELVEYLVEATPDIKPDDFFQMMIISGFAERFEKGDPMVVSGMSGTELHHRVLETCGFSDRTWPEPLIRFDTGVDYWCGYILAYYQWKKNISFARIFESLNYEKLAKLYNTGHTTSDDHALLLVENVSSSGASKTVTRIQAYRKLIGLSQKALADASGVNLRTLQQYEIRDKDINKASAEKVLSMARVLKCRPEDLMEK
ncbi:helix-turn-helix domain-containing protein [Butyrivibrio sp. INlla16]|uniref:helix-turn-helix domain-containing protein n=1 Tax=Butyrivibrio sp. INlla16 TaxID=1520807 RepID=UPI00088A0DBD|nr:helix-turn-helix transcriptional regulator [Butyrivibrio sp. INlla16]SDB03607.1 Helix-turn-helix [Butyrivibrio sp. INlla16]